MGRPLKYLSIIVFTLFVMVGVLLVSYSVPDQSVDALKSRWAEAPSQFLDVAGMQIHLRDEGPRDDPAPIVLIHGTSASLHTWNGWSEALIDQHRVIRFDLPAFGLTGPSPEGNYAIEYYADVVVAVLDALGVDKGLLVGNSLGGYIAWATAVLHPQRVEKLVLVDSSGYSYDAKSVPIAFTLAQIPVLRHLVQDILPRRLVESSVKNVFANPELVTPDLVDRYFELATREGNRTALIQRFEQTMPGKLAARIPEINVPTLILWGAQDELIPAKFAHRFHKDITNSRMVIFDDLGHTPQEENPQATVAVFKEFISD